MGTARANARLPGGAWRGGGMAKAPPAARAVTVVVGEGVGPEVMRAALRVLRAAGARLELQAGDGGEADARGATAAAAPDALDAIARTGLALVGPQAGVAAQQVRQRLGALVRVQPVRELPGVRTSYSGSGVDFVLVSGGEPAVPAGGERSSPAGVVRPAGAVSAGESQRVARTAFEVALAERHTAVECVTRSEADEVGEAAFARAFDEVAREYAALPAEHSALRQCALQLVLRPERFGVLAASAPAATVIDELAAGLVGGRGVLAAARLGEEVAIFGPAHGCVVALAGLNRANPTGAVLAGVMLLRHVGQVETADLIEQALLVTLERGLRTADLPGGRPPLTTEAFADAVITNLGRRLPGWEGRLYRARTLPRPPEPPAGHRPARLLGVDVYLQTAGGAEEVGTTLELLAEDLPLRLRFVSNPGRVAYPPRNGTPAESDLWCARFVPAAPAELADATVLLLLDRVAERFRWLHVEKLYDAAAPVADVIPLSAS